MSEKELKGGANRNIPKKGKKYYLVGHAGIDDGIADFDVTILAGREGDVSVGRSL